MGSVVQGSSEQPLGHVKVAFEKRSYVRPSSSSGVLRVTDRARALVAPRHGVYFYQDSNELVEVVAKFVIVSLSGGVPAVLIATSEHLVGVTRHLAQAGYDPSELEARRMLTLLNARDTLKSIAVDGKPHAQRLTALVGGVLEEVRKHSQQPCLSLYGEMVDILWSEGRREAALRLEDLWNRLQETSRLNLLCGYATSAGEHVGDARIRCLHDHILQLAPGGEAGLLLTTPNDSESDVSLRGSLREFWLTEDALRSNEVQLQFIVNALPVLVSYVDANERFRLANHRYEEWFGLAGRGTPGKHLKDVVGGDAYEQMRPHIERALSGQMVVHEQTLPIPTGGQRSAEATYIPHLGENGEVHGLVTLVADISERKALESARVAVALRTERLMKVATALAEAITPDEVYSAIVSQTSFVLNASSSGLWLCDTSDPNLIHLVRGFGYTPSSEAALLSLRLDAKDRTPVSDALTNGVPVWIPSQAHLLELYPHLSGLVSKGRSYGIAALPLVAQSGKLGALAFTFDGTLTLDEEGKTLLRLVAHYCTQALERLRMLETERQARAEAAASASRLSLLSRASKVFLEPKPDLQAVLGHVAAAVTVEHASACAIHLLSENGRELVLHALRERSALEDHGGPSVWLSDAVRIGEGFMGSGAAFRGALTRASLLVVPLRVRGEFLGILSANRAGEAPAFSLHDRHLMEELADRTALAIESNRLYSESKQAQLRAELLYEMAGAVIRAECVEDVYDAALHAIERALGAPRSAILGSDEHGKMRFKRWRGLSDSYRAAVDGHSPWEKDARSARPILVPNVFEDASMASYAHVFAAEHIGALAFIPLQAPVQAGGKLIGKFMVYYPAPRVLSTAEIEMAQAIAHHVASAMTRFAALGELKKTVHFNEMFTGILGHDLRNPLSGIMSAAQLMAIREQGEHIQKPLNLILSSGTRMARMIDQLLDFTRVRLEAGIPLKLAECDLLEILRQTLDELQGASSVYRFVVDNLAQETTGRWDADRLSQVFSNLLANAARHGAPGQRVRVAVREIESGLRVDVHNHGSIPTELLPRIFEPLVTVGRAGGEGLGLGLHIAQEIVKAHRGRIEVRSSSEEGTTFSVYLPRVLRSDLA